MNRKLFLVALTVCTVVQIGPLAQSPLNQPAMADWLTDGGDSQRTAWQKNERLLSVSSVKGMKLLWKYKTDNQPREMHALFPPLIVGRVQTAAGLRQVAVVAGISDNLYAIDVATGAAKPLVDKGSNNSVRLAGDRLVFAKDTLKSPVELFSMRPDGSDLRQVTSLNGARVRATCGGECRAGRGQACAARAGRAGADLDQPRRHRAGQAGAR